MTIRRLHNSLAAHPPAVGHSSSRLVPPYAYTYSPSTPSTLRPPYSYVATTFKGSALGVHEAMGRSLKAQVNYGIYQREGRSDGWTEWVNEIVKNESLRQRVVRAWEETLAALQGIKDLGNQIPQVAFHSLASHLNCESTVEAIRNTGAIVVRDVVPDAEAMRWAHQVLQAINNASGRAVYWHPSLIAARSHPSVLSANAQLAYSLLQQDVYIEADTIRDGIASSRTKPDLALPWQAHNALSSHLALTPSLSFTDVNCGDTCLSPSIHAATYTLLRPLFRAVKSKISFYDPSAYLQPQNWALDPVISSSPSSVNDLPHLAGAKVLLPRLLPGDVVLHHTALPLFNQPTGQIFLPIHPRKKDSNKQWILKQREAFERGLPPPGVGEPGEDMVVAEARGRKEDIPSRAGREAMGYE
ncbi:uncharacterized protein L203_102907 [Cryptococcus depauperatus CBS 7841]|uniref:Uncharacterized protein n=1 Tax=Cryptococcus depauperatus CBS 7841 TaxID=1295531 RepID=A0A1E3IB21_9TREE|nr:hypothetical protein L203_04711 [Cryptococcus depauperatus CBS 7841]